MLRGEKTGLRARHDEDVPVLRAELHDDVPGHARADGAAWTPRSPGRDWSPYAIAEPSEGAALFSVVELSSGDLAGAAQLWGIDNHNRSAHLGIGLFPAYRGRGLGLDTVRTLCTYGFTVRGLHRLQLETLADNAAMIASAERAGFRREGTIRQSAWVYGCFGDEIVLGMLAEEWPDGAPAA